MKRPKVGVIGIGGQSAFLSTDHVPAPGETVRCESLFFELGGKGYNQALACARMGVQTVFIGAVGDDVNGLACRKELEKEGIITCLIRKNEPTAYAVITVSNSGENAVEVFAGAAKKLDPMDLRMDNVHAELKDCDYLLLQNEISMPCLKEACKIAQELGIPVIWNPAPADHLAGELLQQCDLVIPNYGEAKLLTGISEDEEVSDEKLVKALRKMKLENAIVTLGARGALVMEGDTYKIFPAFSCGQTVDTTGAGDTFVGTLTACLAMGKCLTDAVQIAVVAAGISVTRHGAAGSIPNRTEIARAADDLL